MTKTSKTKAVLTFGERVAAYRHKHGLSYRQAQEESGVNKGNIVRIEQGRQPNLQTFIGLSLWIKVPERDLRAVMREFAPPAPST